MNRRALWVFFVPALVAVALGPSVTSVANTPRQPRVLVSAAPLSGETAQDNHLASAAAVVDTQWQWTSGWRTPVSGEHDVMLYDAARGASLVGDAWANESASPPSGAGPFRDQAAEYNADRVVVVLFGGDSASTETRLYDGQSWTLHRVPGPPPRTLPATVYDAARKTLVLFGADRPARPFSYLGDARDLDEQR
jgi:hypothetical protein